MEAHWLIKKVEKYHVHIHQAYNIIQVETKGIIFKNTILQMVFKAINNITGPHSFVLTLIILGAYSHIITDLLLLVFQQQ